MKVVDLEGNIHKWSVKGEVVTADSRPRSALHVKARDLIKEMFPTMQLVEEVPIHVKPRKVLYLDFCIPLIKLVVEVHGSQHYQFSPHFHKDRWSFIKSLKNDSMKEEWCEINNFALVVLKHDEQDQWQTQLNPSAE